MTKRTKLSEPEVRQELENLSGWKIENAKLHKEFQFSTFVEAFGFMTQVAILAEKMDHHPDWSNVYNHVSIDLTTHDLGGISTYDFQLAAQIDNLK